MSYVEIIANAGMADIIPVCVFKFFIFAITLAFVSIKASSFVTLKLEIEQLM
jgi:hypothetical protein